MKKRFYLGLIMGLSLCVIAAQAQNQSKKTVHNDGSYEMRSTSPGLVIENLNEDIQICYSKKEVTRIGERALHQLTLNFEGAFNYAILLTEGEDLVYVFPDEIENNTFMGDLPEGYYDIFVVAQLDEVDYAMLSYEIELTKNASLDIKIADADKLVAFEAVDENNVSFNGREAINYRMNMYLEMRPEVGFWGGLSEVLYDEAVVPVRCYINKVALKGKLYAIADILMEDNMHYHITINTDNNVTEDTVYKNEGGDFAYYTQHLNMDKDLPGHAHSSVASVILRREGAMVHTDVAWQYAPSRRLDREKPFVMYANPNIPDTSRHGEYWYYYYPIVYTYNAEVPHSDEDGRARITMFPTGVNDNKEIVWDYATIEDQEYLWSAGHAFITALQSPTTLTLPSGSELYGGYRAPYVSFQSYCFPATGSSPATIGGTFNYRGENAEQFFYQTDVVVTGTANGQALFSEDNVNGFYAEVGSNIKEVTIEATNDKLVAYGRKMINHTKVVFDLSKEDVITPTLTMIRVLDKNGLPKVQFHSMADAVIELSAGDFDIDPIYYDVLYKAVPAVEIEWSVDGETYHRLDAVRVESKWDKVSGDFFRVSLTPVADANIINQWVIVRLTLSDEAGNTITQTFNPLFYVGTGVGVSETSKSGMKHVAYPNPFTETVNIEIERALSGPCCFEIYDVTGKAIYRQETMGGDVSTFVWNGACAVPGVYFYSIYNEKEVVKGKIIKQ